MGRYFKKNDDGSIQFGSERAHQNPWGHVVESVSLDVDAAGQGSHVDYDVAVLNIRRLGGEYVEAIIGGEDMVYDAIQALSLAYKQLKIKRLKKEMAVHEREIAALERQINGEFDDDPE